MKTESNSHGPFSFLYVVQLFSFLFNLEFKLTLEYYRSHTYTGHACLIATPTQGNDTTFNPKLKTLSLWVFFFFYILFNFSHPI